MRAHAAEAAFFIIMSVFPILMLLLTLLRYTTLTTEQIIFTIEELTPFAITQELQPVVDSIFNQSTALVPWTALVAVWTAGKGILGLSDGLNSIFQIEETKNYFVTTVPLCLLYGCHGAGTYRESLYSRIWIQHRDVSAEKNSTSDRLPGSN